VKGVVRGRRRTGRKIMRQGRTGVGIALALGGFSGWWTVLLGAARIPLVLTLVQDPFRACLRAAALLCGRCSGTDGSAGGLRALRSRLIGLRAMVAAAQPGIGRSRELMCHAWSRRWFAGVCGRCFAVRLRPLASWLGRSDCCARRLSQRLACQLLVPLLRAFSALGAAVVESGEGTPVTDMLPAF
jgi:hypothetical protein